LRDRYEAEGAEGLIDFTAYQARGVRFLVERIDVAVDGTSAGDCAQASGLGWSKSTAALSRCTT
jgi:hypothetical protein